jgi:hypothetical protein
MLRARFSVPLSAIVVMLVVDLAAPSTAVAKWRLCTAGRPAPVCEAYCTPVVATFDTAKECAAVKTKAVPVRPNNLKKPAKPAGAAGLAACRRKFGKEVTSATISSDGRALQCYGANNDRTAARGDCKNRFGPMAQVRWHRGKLYCAVP